MRQYRYSLGAEAVAAFHQASKRDRVALLDAFTKLAAHPAQNDVLFERGGDGRLWSVKRFGVWRVTWWLDDPIWTVQIVECQRLEHRRRLPS